MNSLLARPTTALGIGGLVAAATLAVWLAESRGDALGLVSFLVRFLHVIAAMLWVGSIWFVNFVQLKAMQESDEAGRAALLRHVVPQVATLFRQGANIVLISGAVLMLTTGYALDRWVFPSAVYIATPRNLMLWGGIVGALVMWGVVHMVIWPNLRVVLDGTATAEAKAKARGRMQLAARLNLALALPVTFVMVAAAHLY